MNAPRAVVLAVLLTACTTNPSKPDPPVSSDPTPNCTCADGCVAACDVTDEKTTYRKVPREPDAADDRMVAQEAPEAFDLWEERIEPIAESKVEQLAREIGEDPADIVAMYRADFVRGQGEELAVVTKTGELAVYRGDDVVARLTLGEPAGPVEATRLIDQRAEVVVRYESDGVQRLSVVRAIGSALAQVFDVELTGRTVELVHLGDERAIRVAESDGSASVFRWNPWEGVFRVPTRAPTAP